VLKPGGRLLILEFMRPASPALRQFYSGFNKLLAPLGARISGHPVAYNYLPQSIEGFESRSQFTGLLARQGFVNLRCFEHSGGIATSFLANKAVAY
jgi:demethylmenaquinone methyltransferase/2-methoxy-6-polyprenyl-1,4-benzoquinol methylase